MEVIKPPDEDTNTTDGTSGRSPDNREPTRISLPVSNDEVSPEEEAAQVFADLEADPHYTKVDLSAYEGLTRVTFIPGLAGTGTQTPEDGDSE
jgi:hypothetical protein